MVKSMVEPLESHLVASIQAMVLRSPTFLVGAARRFGEVFCCRRTTWCGIIPPEATRLQNMSFSLALFFGRHDWVGS